MKVFKKTSELRFELKKHRLSDKRIGLVPTMGALHMGHISLVKEAQKTADIVCVSIFVNPAQFNSLEDLDKYPRNLEKDLLLLKECGCHIVFAPEVDEMYPFNHDLTVNFGLIENQLEGKFRPGHFAGVGLIVSKLFNIFQPNQAFFGQKDIQQFYIIKKLINQLSFPVELTKVATLREPNGLAMSSRNERLNIKDKEEASLIYKSLAHAEKELKSGIDFVTVQKEVRELFNSSKRLELEYFELVETDNFTPIKLLTQGKEMALCIAAQIGQVRLIDNFVLNY